MKKLISRKSGLIAATVALSLLAASVATGENVQKGNIFINFHGSISPTKLPQKELAPVAVQMGAKIRPADEDIELPRLTRIVLDINSNGVIDAKGLPICSLGKLLNSSSAQAKRFCGEAEVGSGNVTLRVQFPGQGPFASNGPLVAFNGKAKGKQVIFAHIDSRGKLNSTEVLTFFVKRTKGTYGTSLTADVGNIASGNGYISAFDMSLRRRYTLKGEKRSFVSASCPLPKGVPVASFSFARSTFGFEDGSKVTSTLRKECRARR